MDIKSLLDKEYVRYAICLIVGITVGVLFYPTKTIEEKINKKHEQEVSQLKQTFLIEKTSLIESLKISKQELSSYKKEAEEKLTKKTEQIMDLKSKQKTAYFKIIKPDGTVEIKKFSESEVNESTRVVEQIQQEFKVKIAAIEEKWEKIHKSRIEELEKNFKQKEANYLRTLDELEKTKKVTINPKKFSLDIGVLSNKTYYGHFTMDLWGPIIIGVQGQLNNNNPYSTIGAGLGVRF